MAEAQPPKSYRTLIANKAVNDAFPSPFTSPQIPTDPDDLKKHIEQSEIKSNPKLKIGILGAGAAGLCTAMILKKLGREFEILEARPHLHGEDSPVGGRMFTYYFDKPKKQQYDYFDVGAMRFPYIPGMYPTFDLIDWLQLTDHMIDYYFKSEGTVRYFNEDATHPLSVIFSKLESTTQERSRRNSRTRMPRISSTTSLGNSPIKFQNPVAHSKKCTRMSSNPWTNFRRATIS
jgi:hypothetical protein